MTLFELYILMLTVGMLTTVVSFLMGSGHDADGDGHFDHIDHFGSDHSPGNPDGGHGGVTVSQIFSIRNIFAFLAGYGAAGILALQAGLSGPWSAVVGLIAGVLFAYIIFMVYRVLGKQQSNSMPSLVRLAGKRAVVVTPIPLDGLGEIRLNNEYGVSTTLPARAEGKPFPADASVIVVSVDAGTATVKA